MNLELYNILNVFPQTRNILLVIVLILVLLHLKKHFCLDQFPEVEVSLLWQEALALRESILTRRIVTELERREKLGVIVVFRPKFNLQ